MPIDFGSLKKMEGLPALAHARIGNVKGRLLVVVKLRKGAEPPPYVLPRAEFGADILSAEIALEDLPRLEDDPAVESYSPSRALPGIE
jgi:hypothetical protein